MATSASPPTRTPLTLPHRVDKPWGHEIWWALTDDYAGKILHVRAGERLSLQYHERKGRVVLRAVGAADPGAGAQRG